MKRVRTLVCEADTSNLERLADFIRSACGNSDRVFLIELAVAEAVTNTIKHSGATQICVHVIETRHHIDIRIQDDGVEFDTVATEPQPFGALREHGFGIGIIKKVADRLCYVYQDSQNHLTLRFNRNTSGYAEP